MSLGCLSDIWIVTMIDTFRKNEYVKKVFWTLLVAMAGLVLARVVDGDNSAGSGDYYGNGGVR
jgi:hypothetical protein